MTRGALSRWSVPVLAVASVALVLVRTSQGLGGLLVDTLSPAETMALGDEAQSLAGGFPSGAQLTAISAPLRLYQVFDALGLGVVGATQWMIGLEALAMFVGIYAAVRVLRPGTTTLVAGFAAAVATVGYALNGHNLANFGFIYGWNYGFAAAVGTIALAFALRRRWTACACAVVGVALIHTVIAVLIVLAVAPLVVVDIARRRFVLRWPVGLAAAVGAAYLLASRGDLQSPTGRLDVGAYVARVRAFQYHYFFQFSASFLRSYAEDIASWLIAVVLVVAACLTLSRLNDGSLAARTAMVLAAIGVLSMLGWWHSNLAEPNVTLLVVTLHRSSTFVNLLLLALVVPLLFEQAAERHLQVTATSVTVWCLLPDPVDHARLGAIVLGSAVWWMVVEVKQRPDRASILAASVTAPLVCLAAYFLVVSPGIAGDGWDAFGRALRRDGGLIAACGLLLALALARYRHGAERHIGRGVVVALVIGATAVLLLGRSVTDNPRALAGPGQERRDDLIDVAEWARDETAGDAVFLLPLRDYGFGWRTFSERASAGQPREWLHYAFLYSRNQEVMDAGTRRAALLGIDADQWFAEHPRLGVGGQLVRALSARFAEMTDEQAAQFATELGADFVIVERDALRPLPCFRMVKSNATFAVLDVQPECVTQ